MKYVSLWTKAQSFLTVISPQTLSLKVFYKLRRAVLRVITENWGCWRKESPHLFWTLLNGSERNGHFHIRIHLILLMMWKKARWHFYSTYFFVHMNAQLGDLTKVSVFLCLCRFSFACTQDNVGLELSFPECKVQSTLRVLLALTFTTCLKLQHLPDVCSSATKCRTKHKSCITGSAWLLSQHHQPQQNHSMVCLQKQAQTDPGSSDVLQVGLKQAWCCTKMWKH